jgi:hypothetical protein
MHGFSKKNCDPMRNMHILSGLHRQCRAGERQNLLVLNHTRLACEVVCHHISRMYWKDAVEFSFYLVETFALPFAILVFVFERRKERLAEEEELNQRLSDEYIGFLKLVLDNADLQLLHRHAPLRELTEEQEERKFALFGILVSIFERAYILVYEERLNRQTRRLWSSWEDYMREWCRRPDFRKALPELLEGEDPEFRAHIEKVAQVIAPQ